MPSFAASSARGGRSSAANTDVPDLSAMRRSTNALLYLPANFPVADVLSQWRTYDLQGARRVGPVVDSLARHRWHDYDGTDAARPRADHLGRGYWLQARRLAGQGADGDVDGPRQRRVGRGHRGDEAGAG